MQALLSQLLMVAQFAVMAVVIVGQQAAPYLERAGIVLPAETWQTVREKKIAVLMGVWFIGNTIRQSLISTGAFEVYYNNTLIFSKLDTQRMPTLAEIVGGISEAMSASGDSGR